MRAPTMLLLLVVSLSPATAFAAERSPHHEAAATVAGEAEIKIGDTLQAVRDVSLDEAIIAEGSKVSVSGRRKANGFVVLDVALADGHVVKGVPLAEIRKSFKRIVSRS